MEPKIKKIDKSFTKKFRKEDGIQLAPYKTIRFKINIKSDLKNQDNKGMFRTLKNKGFFGRGTCNFLRMQESAQ